jgi:glycosyltransferase involved in cell wall biosynthesis
MSEPTISVCLPIRNAQASIERFLASFRPHVDELCFLDTGSTDRTRELLALHAARPGARIVVETALWEDDYASARNTAAALATGDYVMTADDDEVLFGGHNIQQLLAEAPDAALARRIDIEEPGICKPWFGIRIYRREYAQLWTGRVHEGLDLPETALLEAVRPDLVSVGHRRHMAPYRHGHRRLVELATAQSPSRSVWFFLGRHLLEDDGNLSAAAAAFERAADGGPWARSELGEVRCAFEYLAHTRAKLGEHSEAVAALVGARQALEQMLADPLLRRCMELDDLHPIGKDHPVWQFANEVLAAADVPREAFSLDAGQRRIYGLLSRRHSLRSRIRSAVR